MYSTTPATLGIEYTQQTARSTLNSTATTLTTILHLRNQSLIPFSLPLQSGILAQHSLSVVFFSQNIISGLLIIYLHHHLHI
jgi:hypothetical protein